MLLILYSIFDWLIFTVLIFILWIFQVLSDDINEILIHLEIFLSFIDMRHDEDVKILSLKDEKILQNVRKLLVKRCIAILNF
jgi:hypothetical protein